MNIRQLLRFKAFGLALLVILGSALPASAREHREQDSTLFAMGQKGAVLLAIDVENRTTTAIGQTGSPVQSLALAITPDGTAAYTIAKAQSASEAQLAKIDLATGATTPVGQPLRNSFHYPLPDGLYVMGMTFSPDGVLYAAGDFTTTSDTFNSLYTIDLTTGLATRVGPFGVGTSKSAFIMSFSFDPEGDMYGASMMSLYKIDRETGAATMVVDFAGAVTTPSKVMGIAFDRDGNLYVADYLPTDSRIYAVDVETGQLTTLLTAGPFVHNISFKPANKWERK